jgi:hypothetical protein
LLESRVPPLVERDLELSGGGEAIWRITPAGLRAVGAI